MLSPVDPPFRAFRGSRVVLFEAFSGKCTLEKRSYFQLVSAVCKYVSIGLMSNKMVKTEEVYRKGIGKITTIEAWKRYLGK